MDAEIASAAIGVIACILVYIGSKQSLTNLKEEAINPTKGESVSMQDAYMFPVYGSAVLFGLYMVFKLVKKEYLSYLIAVYFGFAGVYSLTNFFANLANSIYSINKSDFQLTLKQGKKKHYDLKVSLMQLIMSVPSVVVVGLYLYSKNWILSNLLAVSFCLSALKLIKLDGFKTGVMLLAGLFVYDIFWVFGTNVMVSVATKFDAPIKILWPKNIIQSLINRTEDPKFTLLGLGDIVIPGAFVAMCLEFDRFRHFKKNNIQDEQQQANITNFQKPYFVTCFVSYCLGLMLTMVVMHTFKSAQPALLYLSPSCSLSVIILAFIKKELNLMLEYESMQAKKERLAKENNQPLSSSSGESSENENNTSSNNNSFSQLNNTSRNEISTSNLSFVSNSSSKQRNKSKLKQ